LSRARAHAAAPALENLSRRLAPQDASRVRRMLRELRAAAPEKARAEELEQIQERLRKLSVKLEELEARAKSQTR
jgi:hypothetical protein